MNEQETLPPEGPSLDPAMTTGDATIAGVETGGPAAARKAERDLLGHRLGRYLIMRKLGEGGMGQVYEAHDEELDRRVAIKLLHAKYSRKPVQRARMQREARAMAKIAHPNVVAVHDVGDAEDGGLFVAMEFVRGQTLRAWQDGLDPSSARDRKALLEVYIQAGRGLAAAHARGLVHRDFKPDNVIVGEDGRPRVLDFGLVAPAAVPREQPAAAPREPREPREPQEPDLDLSLTRTGSMMGTPLFMSAEQIRGAPSDERSDQFNFCASLYQALYGTSAFEGDNVHALMASVLDGRLRPPPTEGAVPDWLRAVVLRGLAGDPSQRWPTMDALLQALAVDPIARRRRRLAVFAALVTLVGVCVAAVLGGLRLRERARTRALEEAALVRLEALDAAIERDPEQGRAAFESFVEHPENWGTRALALAWLHEAERAREDPPTRLAAYAQAYVLATETRTQREALLGLAREFRSKLRWPELARALALLEGAPDPSGEIERLSLESDLAHREFGAAALALAGSGAQPELLPIVEALGRGTPADFGGDLVEYNLILDPRANSLVSIVNTKPLVLEAGGALTPVRPGSATTDAPREGPLVVDRAEADGQSVARLSRLVGRELVELYRWPEQSPATALAHDLDGDGALEFYVGTGPYTRHLVELVEDREGRWSTRAPAPLLDRRESDIHSLRAADLDGDGRDELVLAHGPWNAFELRVLRRELGAATLDSLARARLGYIHALHLLDHRPEQPGGVELLVLMEDEYRPPASFVPDVAAAAKPGLLGFRLRQGQLELTRTIPTPELGEGSSLRHRQTFLADLDGDGRAELIANALLSERGQPTQHALCKIYVLDEEGSHSALTLLDARVNAVADVDGDGDDELLIRLEDVDEDWILGAGQQHPPAVEIERLSPDAQMIADPVLAQMWQRAEELAAMSLDLEAARSFSSFAAQTRDHTLEARALLRAGDLLASHGEDLDAARLYARAARAGPRPELVAANAAVAALRRRGDLQDALDTLAPFEDAAPLAETRAELERLLSPARTYTLELDAPLPPGWRLDAPIHLRRDRLARTLEVHGHVESTLLARPVRWDGEFLMLEVDLDFTRGGWGSQLALGVFDERGVPTASVELLVHGGRSDLSYRVICHVGGKRRVLLDQPAAAGPPGRHRLRVVWDREGNHGSCSLRDREDRERVYHRLDLDERELAPSYSLELRSAFAGDAPTGLSATLHELSITGAELAPLSAQPEATGLARALVEGEHLEVLRRTEDTDDPDAQLWRVVAFTRLARIVEAAEVLAELADDPQSWARIEPSVVALLNSEPGIYAAVVELALGPQRRASLLVSAWEAWFTVNSEDAEAARVLLDGLAELDAGAELHHLELRGLVHERIGAHARAAADYQSVLEGILTEQGEGPEADEMRLKIARQAALAGDEARARSLVAELLASPAGVELHAEAIADDPQLAPLAP